MIGGMSIQPSEFAKLAVVTMMALWVAERTEGSWRQWVVGNLDVGGMLAIAAVPALMILLQPDLGPCWCRGDRLRGGRRLRRRSPLAGRPGASGVGLAGMAVQGGFSRTTSSTGSWRSPTRRWTLGSGLQHRAGPDRDRQRRRLRPGPLRRLPDARGLRPRAADRLHLHRGRRGARPGGRRGDHRAPGIVIWRALAIAAAAADIFGRLPRRCRRRFASRRSRTSGCASGSCPSPGSRSRWSRTAARRCSPACWPSACCRTSTAHPAVDGVGLLPRSRCALAVLSPRAYGRTLGGTPHPRPKCPIRRSAESDLDPRVGPASVCPRLEPLGSQVSKPIQYVAGEFNSTSKAWDDAQVRWALMYPDAYEVGLPNQGVQILYEVLNERGWILAERTYSVWPTSRSDARARHPAIHRRRPPSLAAFVLLGLSFSTELGYTNLLTALDLAGIPLHAVDRTDEHPLVVAGGHAAFNPEPSRTSSTPPSWVTVRNVLQLFLSDRHLSVRRRRPDRSGDRPDGRPADARAEVQHDSTNLQHQFVVRVRTAGRHRSFTRRSMGAATWRRIRKRASTQSPADRMGPVDFLPERTARRTRPMRTTTHGR